MLGQERFPLHYEHWVGLEVKQRAPAGVCTLATHVDRRLEREGEPGSMSPQII